MSDKQLRKYNIINMRYTKDAVLLTDTTLDEWRYVNGKLFHLNNRGNTKMEFHFQCDIKNLQKALEYISSHAKRLYKPKKMSRVEYLFTII